MSITNYKLPLAIKIEDINVDFDDYKDQYYSCRLLDKSGRIIMTYNTKKKTFRTKLEKIFKKIDKFCGQDNPFALDLLYKIDQCRSIEDVENFLKSVK